MARKGAKKTIRRKRRPKSKRPDVILQVAKAIGALAILLLVVVSAALLARFVIKPHPTDVPPVVRNAAPPASSKIPPKYEVFSTKPIPPKPITPLTQLPGGQVPIVAIVVDDIGYDLDTTRKLLSLDAPLTFSVLPYGPHSRSLAMEARSKGHEIMLHLPMEPAEFPEIDPGPGALLSQMSPDELINALNANLDLIPGLSGVNNHMGSGISTSPERMRQIFSILKKRGLYYIDSRTTAETVARPSAELLQLRFTERDIFIDHFENESFVRGQLKALIARARQQGYAVGIAHPHPVTLQILTEYLPQLKHAVELVPASMVVDAAVLARRNHAQAVR